MKLSRERMQQALQTMPIESLMGRGVSGNLTPKEKRFAREVAINGASKVEAYRKAYNTKSKHTQRKEPYMVANRPSVAQEIDALRLAEAAQALQTPAQLRALVIQTLVQTAIDPDTKPAVRVQAAKVLGTVTEVAAFTERKEVRTISSSEDARAKVMAEIRALMLGTEDAEDIQARELLEELSNPADTVGGYDDSQPVDFIGDDTSDQPENEGKHGFLSTNDPQIVGGVCDPVGGGQPDLGVGALDSYDILSHSNDSTLDSNPEPK
jgi:hypothetical protein